MQGGGSRKGMPCASSGSQPPATIAAPIARRSSRAGNGCSARIQRGTCAGWPRGRCARAPSPSAQPLALKPPLAQAPAPAPAHVQQQRSPRCSWEDDRGAAAVRCKWEGKGNVQPRTVGVGRARTLLRGNADCAKNNTAWRRRSLFLPDACPGKASFSAVHALSGSSWCVILQAAAGRRPACPAARAQPTASAQGWGGPQAGPQVALASGPRQPGVGTHAIVFVWLWGRLLPGEQSTGRQSQRQTPAAHQPSPGINTVRHPPNAAPRARRRAGSRGAADTRMHAWQTADGAAPCVRMPADHRQGELPSPPGLLMLQHTTSALVRLSPAARALSSRRWRRRWAIRRLEMLGSRVFPPACPLNWCLPYCQEESWESWTAAETFDVWRQLGAAGPRRHRRSRVQAALVPGSQAASPANSCRRTSIRAARLQAAPTSWAPSG